MDLIKTEKFCASKETINKERENTSYKMEENFYKSDKHPEYIKNYNSAIKKTTQLKTGKRFEYTFPQRIYINGE